MSTKSSDATWLAVIGELLLSQLQSSEIDLSALPVDLYWELLDGRRRYDPSVNLVAGMFGLGSIAHDVERLRDSELTMDIAEDPVLLGHALVWYSSVLRSIGDDLLRKTIDRT